MNKEPIHKHLDTVNDGARVGVVIGYQSHEAPVSYLVKFADTVEWLAEDALSAGVIEASAEALPAVVSAEAEQPAVVEAAPEQPAEETAAA